MFHGGQAWAGVVVEFLSCQFGGHRDRDMEVQVSPRNRKMGKA